MLEEGEELNMDSTAVYNIDEQLLQLQDMVNGMELQLDTRYGEFTVSHTFFAALVMFRSTATT